MVRTLQDQLVKKGLVKKTDKKARTTHVPKETFSKREIEELMGIKRPTYHKVKGSFRSR